jgi:putative transposase
VGRRAGWVVVRVSPPSRPTACAPAWMVCLRAVRPPARRLRRSASEPSDRLRAGCAGAPSGPTASGVGGLPPSRPTACAPAAPVLRAASGFDGLETLYIELNQRFMKYQTGAIYHIYNRGINRQKIFFEERNYHYFLRKMRTLLKPHAFILAYCLMPNHFHWLISPTHEGEELSGKRIPVFGNSMAPEMLGIQNLSNSIGILLSSFTQGINKSQGRTGSLFQQNTPAVECFRYDGNLWSPSEGPSDHSHPVNCFHYLHQNPVAAGLVGFPDEWPYSSALDYHGLRDDNLCSYNVAASMLNVKRTPYRL